ncbi:MAG TPA: hypothetical protein V6C88_19865 [Chroococcidiopsis sp.]
MRNISKAVEPESLTRHRCNINSDYDNYPEKDDLRKSLVAEQRGLCCYCTQRIRPTVDKMKIEHWQCQSRFPEKQLNYANLLGACLGCQGQTLEKQHCDTRKGDRDLTYNPANPEHDVEGKIDFRGDGIIRSDDPIFNDEIHEVLNLNTRILVKNRRAALGVVTSQFMARNPSKPVSKAAIQKELRKWNGETDDGELQEFCQIAVYYLRKKLKKMP